MTPDYPPPPPPAAPRRLRRPARLLGLGLASLVAAGALGAALDGGSPSDPPRSSSAPAPESGLRGWVARHGTESAAVMARVEGYAGDVAAAASEGDLLGALSLCSDGAAYLSSVALEAVSLDPDAPAEWTRTINLWARGFAACSEGDLDGATDLIAQGTDSIEDLTALLEGIQP